MRVRIFTGNRFSDSAAALSAALVGVGIRAKQIKRENSLYVPREGDFIVNWGSSRPFDVGSATLINPFEPVHKAIDKRQTYELLRAGEVKVPDFAFTIEAARQLEAPRGLIVRTTMTGHSGAGTYFIEAGNDIPTEVAGRRVVCWQKYIAKNAEYRVHVFGDTVVDVQKKRRRTEEVDDASSYIRNLVNGWVYCRNNVSLEEAHKQLAINAVRALGLDFGAVDLITTSRGVGFVLEVNTAPGLDGTTTTVYAEQLRKIFVGE